MIAAADGKHGPDARTPEVSRRAPQASLSSRAGQQSFARLQLASVKRADSSRFVAEYQRIRRIVTARWYPSHMDIDQADPAEQNQDLHGPARGVQSAGAQLIRHGEAQQRTTAIQRPAAQMTAHGQEHPGTPERGVPGSPANRIGISGAPVG